jgi:transcriptional regulator
MYLPAHFAEQRPEALHALMRAHPLATLVVPTADGIEANHVPMLLDGDAGILRGHVARANGVWRTAPNGDALAVFHGPQAYITPSWYRAKAEHGKVVPTWNYAVVHAHGSLRWIDDAAWLRALVTRLTETHEAGFSAPWHVADAPRDYVDQMLRAIVGFELKITRLEGKFKLSQNRAAADIDGVVAGLDAAGDDASAALVQAYKPGLS